MSTTSVSSPSPSPTVAHPGLRITQQDEGPSVNLATWICLSTTALLVFCKVLSKIIRGQKIVSLRNLQADDYSISAALLFAVAQSIAVSQQVPAGIGQKALNTTDSQISRYEKAVFASEILYLMAISLAKSTTLFLIYLLVQDKTHKLSVRVMMTVTGIWTIVAIFGVLFQCSTPKTWEILSGHCFNQSAFWKGIGSLDIIIDLVLIGLPIFALRKLQTTWARKGAVMIAFAVRILDIPLTVLRLIYISQSLASSDRVYNDWKVAVVTQLGMNISIIVACVPFLKPVMDQLQPGWGTGNVRTGLGYNTIVGRSQNTTGYAMGSVVKSKTLQSSQDAWKDNPIASPSAAFIVHESQRSTSDDIEADKNNIRQTNSYKVESTPKQVLQ